MHSISLSKLDTGPSVANHSVYGKECLSNFVFHTQYPTCGIMDDYVLPLAWEVFGFKVMSLTGDKTPVNQKFFRMHRLASGQ